ncbi:hypothetical protein C8Q72DRAFT_882950 [Fomitopsis betulina]|nr:hypothetical protein C8Q72DRAFT_882950 [Fomitopsis betulina]
MLKMQQPKHKRESCPTAPNYYLHFQVYSRMILQNFVVLSALTTMALAKPATSSPSAPQTGLVARAGLVGCECPTDLTGDQNGALINLYPDLQCTYSGGVVCTYDQSGMLKTTRETDCTAEAMLCSTEDSCECPNDLQGNSGVVVDLGYQCAYVHGACTWSNNGTLTNTEQNNCPADAPCEELGGDN